MSWLYNPAGYSFGRASQARLDRCHPSLGALAGSVIRDCNVSVISGLRTTAEQQVLFAAGRSKLDGVSQLSKHQGDPQLPEHDRVSWAFDIIPYVPGVDVWQRRDLFCLMAGIVFAHAASLGVQIRWGGDWDRDGTTWDQSFDDLPHFELVEPGA